MSCVPWSNETERADYYKAESSRLYRIEERLQKENAKLKELLKLVVSDVFNTNDCEICSDIEECTLRETFNGHCGFWKWQHADKLKELGVE
jgi:hypothetical protein|nr:MAG TPA: hypothetical protein [Bacteriophage sp.]